MVCASTPTRGAAGRTVVAWGAGPLIACNRWRAVAPRRLMVVVVRAHTNRGCCQRHGRRPWRLGCQAGCDAKLARQAPGIVASAGAPWLRLGGIPAHGRLRCLYAPVCLRRRRRQCCKRRTSHRRAIWRCVCAVLPTPGAQQFRRATICRCRMFSKTRDIEIQRQPGIFIVRCSIKQQQNSIKVMVIIKQ